VEPFKIPLPIPPNSKLFQRHQKKLVQNEPTNEAHSVNKMTEPIMLQFLKDPKGIKTPIHRVSRLDENEYSERSLEEPNAVPYNAYNLRYNSMGYVYEDVWNVEEARPLIAKVLLFQDYKLLEKKKHERERKLAKQQEQQDKKDAEVAQNDTQRQNGASATSEVAQRVLEKKAQDEKEKIEELALDLEDKIGPGDIERSTWSTRVQEKYPVVKEIKERVYPLWRAVSFGHTFDVGRKDVKDKTTHELLVNIILQHMEFERLKRTKKALEEESKIPYQYIDVDESLLHALCKEAIKKSENFFDLTIADKMPPKLLQRRKKEFSKEMDEMLADFGLEEEGMFGQSNKLLGDVNIYTELMSGEQNSIIQTDPVKKKEHFIAGSLNVIVDRLTSSVNLILQQNNANTNSGVNVDDQSARDFIKAFLTTYMSFTTPDMLLTKLIQQFNVPKGTLPDLEYATKKKTIQNSVLHVIKLWLTDHFSHFDNKLLSNLINFLDEQAELEGNIKQTVVALKQLIQKKKESRNNALDNQSQDHINNLRQFNMQEKALVKLFSPNLSIHDIDEEEIARQMTLIESDMFRAIEPQELLNLAWDKVKLRNRAPNLIRIINHQQQIGTWVASLICEGMIPYDRKHQFKRMILLCEHLKRMNNFNSLKSVLDGLDNPAVTRLKVSRDMISDTHKNIWSTLHKMMPSNGNNKQYRDLVSSILKSSSDTPVIPYLRYHLKDLEYIEENNKGNERINNVDLINWAKRELCNDVIAEIQKAQSRRYNFVPVHQIQQLIKTMRERRESNDALKNLSYEREPGTVISSPTLLLDRKL
ncbi:Ras guanine nucleotide exchange factor A, partial [Acrasis kona]